MLLARDLIRRNAACYPDKTAFIAGEQTRTWARLRALEPQSP